MVIAETPTFTRQVRELLDEESYRLLQLELVASPTKGRVIPGRGGVQMRDELFEELLGSIREGGKILRGEAKPSGEFRPEEPDVAAIREKYGLSQEKFAAMLGISVRTLQNWEQGRRKPHGPARVLLQVAEEHPEAILETLKKAS